MENKKIITLAQLSKYDELLKSFIENKGYETQSVVAEKIERVEGLITAEQTRVNGEISRVEGLVTAEASARKGEITRVEGLISSETSRVNGLIGGINDDIVEIKLDIKDLTAVADGHDDRISTIEGMVGLGGQGNTSLTTRVSTLESEMDVVEGKVSTLEGQVSTLEGRYTDARVDELIAAGVAEAKGYTYSQSDIDSKIGVGVSGAKTYADGLIATEIERANGAYDVKGAAATAESNAKLYAQEQVSGLKSELLGEGAEAALDTIAELGKALEDHKDAYQGLLTVVGEKAVKSEVEAELAKKVDKEGYIAFTQAEKDKLAGIEAGANKFVLPEGTVIDGEYKHITVTSATVSDGVNTLVLPADMVKDADYADRMAAVEAGVAGVDGKISSAIQAEVTRANGAYDVKGAADGAYDEAVKYVDEKFAGIVYATDAEVEALFA